MSDEKISEVLYKYYPPKRWKNVFNDWTIRFTPPSEFNDPFECKPHVSGVVDSMYLDVFFDEKCAAAIEAFLKEAGSHYKYLFCDKNRLFNVKERFKEKVNDRASHLGEKFYKNIDRSIGIFCLTGDIENLLMWAHYAISHTGFAIGLARNSDFLDHMYDDLLWTPKPVEYSTGRPSKKFAEFSDDLYEYFFIKGKAWEYEQEWRMIASFTNEKFSWVDSSIKGVHELPKKAVYSVVFGACMSDSHIIARCRHIRSQPDCAHIKLQRARLHESRYELIIEDIDPSFYEKK